jgi:tetraspanin-13/31
MCGNFSCSKNALIGLNICYIMVSFLLIGVATYGKTSAYVDSLPIIGGIAACGSFLLIIALVGLVGAVRHHQVLLFFYMVVLGLIFIIQFSIACACLSVSKDKEIFLAETGWNHSSDATKLQAEKYFGCCGFTNHTEGVECKKVPVCDNNGTHCPTCKEMIHDKIDYAFDAAGGLGLFFSFTELAAIVYAFIFRKQLREMSQIA